MNIHNICIRLICQGMTEMQIFISHCNDTLIPIAELVLNDVIQLVDQLFNENLQLYLNLEVFLNDPRQHTPQVSWAND